MTSLHPSLEIKKDQVLGQGTFGVVFGGKLGADDVAVKRIQIVDLDNDSTEEVDGAATPASPSRTAAHREFTALRSFQHPHVLKFYFAYADNDFM